MQALEGEELLGGPGPAHGPGPAERAQQGQRHLRLVRQQARQRANHRYLVASVVIAGVAAVCMALVVLHVLIAENQVKLDDLAHRISTQQAQYERSRLAVAELEAPSRIISVAEGPLGMRQPGSVTYLPAMSTPSRRPVVGGGQVQAAGAGGPGTGGPGTTVPAPSGDADWPLIKPYLNGTP